jgi:tRNA-dihydrouridine synthase
MLPPPSIMQRIEVCKTHLEKSVEWKGPRAGIYEMRRHYSQYFKGIDHFKEFRTRLVMADQIDEIKFILQDVERHYLQMEVLV